MIHLIVHGRVRMCRDIAVQMWMVELEMVKPDQQNKKAHDTAQVHMIAGREADMVMRDVGADEVQVAWAHM